MYQTIEEAHIIFDTILEDFKLINRCFEIFISFEYRGNLALHATDSLVIYSSIWVLTLVIEPLTLSFQEAQYFRSLFRLSKIFMSTINLFFPIISKRLQLIFSFISLDNQFILVKHSWLNSEEGFNIFRSECVESVAIVFYCWIFLFFSFFDLELLFLHFFRLALSGFRWVGRLRILSFFLWNFSFFEPFLN